MSSSHRDRVTIVHNYVTPYRLPLFEALGNVVDLTVLFCRRDDATRKWKTELVPRFFTGRVLPSFSLGFLIVNPTIVAAALRATADVYIVADNDENSTSVLTVAVIARLRRARLIVWNECVASGVPPVVGGRSRVTAAAIDLARRAHRRVLYRLADAFVSMSGPDSDRYLEQRGVQRPRIFTGTQVMPRELLVEPTRAPGAHAGDYLLFIGYLRPEKGVDLLIEAFAKVAGTMELRIAGTGPEAARLQALAAGDPRVRFVGYVDGVAKADLIAGAVAVVVSSSYEPWGLVVNEALAYGTPVVASDAVAGRALLDDDNGRVFPSGDTEALTSVLESIVSDPQVRADLRRGAAATPAQRITDARSGVGHFVSAIESGASQRSG